MDVDIIPYLIGIPLRELLLMKSEMEEALDHAHKTSVELFQRASSWDDWEYYDTLRKYVLAEREKISNLKDLIDDLQSANITAKS